MAAPEEYSESLEVGLEYEAISPKEDKFSKIEITEVLDETKGRYRAKFVDEQDQPVREIGRDRIRYLPPPDPVDEMVFRRHMIVNVWCARDGCWYVSTVLGRLGNGNLTVVVLHIPERREVSPEDIRLQRYFRYGRGFQLERFDD